MSEAGACAKGCGCAHPLSGILNVDKPAGMTSHDVVNAVRKVAGIRRVGHAGTLDPLATGVLLVCVGQATRVSEYLMNSGKTYRAEILFGAATDTYDADGEVAATFPTDNLNPERLRASLAQFEGTIDQQVPAFSAVKKDGQPLYRAARRGSDVEPPVRQVHIYRAELVGWEPPLATVEVECGPGTYIRSLAHEWGARLECGAHLKALRRLSSGAFDVVDAVPLARLQQAAADGDWEHFLLPLDEALMNFPAVIITARQAEALRHGQTVELGAGALTCREGDLARAYTLAGDFVALIRYNAEGNRWVPHKVFGAEGAAGGCQHPRDGHSVHAAD